MTSGFGLQKKGGRRGTVVTRRVEGNMRYLGLEEGRFEECESAGCKCPTCHKRTEEPCCLQDCSECKEDDLVPLVGCDFHNDGIIRE